MPSLPHSVAPQHQAAHHHPSPQVEAACLSPQSRTAAIKPAAECHHGECCLGLPRAMPVPSWSVLGHARLQGGAGRPPAALRPCCAAGAADTQPLPLPPAPASLQPAACSRGVWDQQNSPVAELPVVLPAAAACRRRPGIPARNRPLKSPTTASPSPFCSMIAASPRAPCAARSALQLAGAPQQAGHTALHGAPATASAALPA